jgi:crotonobetaine/carnitine-CoA ligase
MPTQELARIMAEYRSIGGLIERRARELPYKTALKFKDDTYTYAELNSMANRAANGLRQLGVRRGNKVAVMMKNCPEWLAVWFGCAKLGALICPVNVAYKGDGLAYQLNHSESTMLIIDDGYLARLDPIKQDLSALKSVVVRKTGVTFRMHNEIVELSRLLEASADPPTALELNPWDPATILYTSGTTGPPKGCVLPHGQYLIGAEQMVWNCEYNQDSVVYTCLPLFHINAQNYTVLCTMAAGGTVVMDDRFTASGFWQRLIDCGATAFNFIGGIPLILWNQPVSPLEKQHNVKIAFGVPVPKDIWPQWEERFGCRIVYAYGMTENALPVLFPFSATPAPEHLRGAGGKASDSAKVAIFDEHDNPVEAGQIGEVVTQPRIPWSMMIEYYNMPEQTKDAFRNCWFHTGDLGYLDPEGYFFYVDRSKDAIRRRGEMISSWQVESVVGKFPNVAECAAVAVPSEIGEDEILVAVVLTQGSTISAPDLIEYCEQQMAFFQVPRYIRIVDELPKTQTQRVEKYRIRKEGLTGECWDREKSAWI